MTKREFIVVLAITLIVALVWAISDLAHTRSGSKDLPDVQKYLETLEPNFDNEILEKISSLSNAAPAPTAGPFSSPAPTVSPTPLATPSVTPRSTPTPRPLQPVP